MTNIVYRPYQPQDAEDIKKIINEAFYIHRYVTGRLVLDSALEIYLRERLLASTWTRVAVQDERVVGIIMGQVDGQPRLGGRCAAGTPVRRRARRPARLQRRPPLFRPPGNGEASRHLDGDFGLAQVVGRIGLDPGVKIAAAVRQPAQHQSHAPGRRRAIVHELDHQPTRQFVLQGLGRMTDPDRPGGQPRR